MKNITLVKTLISAIVASSSSEDLVDHLTSLVQANEEENRENVIALISGDAVLSCLSEEQVEIVPKDNSKFDFSFAYARPNFLKGDIEVKVNYNQRVVHYFRTKEDADNNKNGTSWSDENRPIAREVIVERSTIFHELLTNWNLGRITFNS